VERAQSSTRPPGAATPRWAFLLCSFAQALETSFMSSTGPDLGTPGDIRSPSRFSQPGYLHLSERIFRRIRHRGRRRPLVRGNGRYALDDLLDLYSGVGRVLTLSRVCKFISVLSQRRRKPPPRQCPQRRRGNSHSLPQSPQQGVFPRTTTS